jgi:dTDP-4-dehydrorhamnose reductase
MGTGHDRIAVIGSGGMLGTDLTEVLVRSGFTVYPLDLPEIDITDYNSLSKNLIPLKPNVIINTAAYTDVDGCESDEGRAIKVNGDGAGNAARAAAESEALMVHISTDYVFDGGKENPYDPEDIPNPQNAYGRSKLAGEKQVKEMAPDHLILRSSWLFGRAGKNFVDTMITLGRERDHLKVVDDQRGSPTYTRHLAEGILKLLGTDLRGTCHLTNSGSCTWYGFAREILSIASIDVRIEPCTSEEYPLPATRPANSVLDCTSAYSAIGGPLPSWQEAVREYLKNGLKFTV